MGGRRVAPRTPGRTGVTYGWAPVEPEAPTCPYLTDGPDGEPGSCQCGQALGHDLEHTWFTPGQYALAPILHPLDLLLTRIGMRSGSAHCPNGHGAERRAHCSSIHGWRWLYTEVSVDFEAPPTLIHDQWGEVWRPGYAWDVTFRPCGCRYRSG